MPSSTTAIQHIRKISCYSIGAKKFAVPSEEHKVSKRILKESVSSHVKFAFVEFTQRTRFVHLYFLKHRCLAHSDCIRHKLDMLLVIRDWITSYRSFEIFEIHQEWLVAEEALCSAGDRSLGGNLWSAFSTVVSPLFFILSIHVGRHSWKGVRCREDNMPHDSMCAQVLARTSPFAGMQAPRSSWGAWIRSLFMLLLSSLVKYQKQRLHVCCSPCRRRSVLWSAPI